MKKLSALTFILLLTVVCAIAGDGEIRINSLGFLPVSEKKATVIVSCSDFLIKDVEKNEVVFKGKAKGPVKQKDVDQEIWILNFSDFSKVGNYYIEIPEVGKSIPFSIKNNVYNDAFYTAFRGLYLWRCGTAVEDNYNGNVYKQGACHLDDGYQDYVGKPGEKADGTGGWHDAGDYGKYVANAGISVGMLFRAWEQFQDKLKDYDFNIPETASNYPDFLEELKWETDWLLKMQYPDGSGRISHKLTRLNFSGFIMPETDDEKRYFSVWGTTATSDFVAMMAMTARYFKPYDPDYAQICLEAAEKSYSFLNENPDYVRFKQGDFRTGAYMSKDWDDRIWAAVELWETTGEKKYLEDFENRIKELEIISTIDWDWQNVTNLALVTYLLSDKKGKTKEVLTMVKKSFIDVADSIVLNAQNDVYGRTLGGKYYWGCNGTVVRQTMNLQTAYQLTGDKKYINAAIDAISHVFGRNYYNRSYVTGLGINPPMRPHDRRSGADGIDEPWPGYIVGGGHSATDWVDEEASYSKNEIALNWQAALIYALAGFIE